MEQNEIAILAESNNRAILVFTGVTIVFLPLSFFTSYFGMNLQGIANTSKSETYFWKVCGSIAFLIIFAIVLYAFKESIHRRLWGSFRDTFLSPVRGGEEEDDQGLPLDWELRLL
jgi:hypothetical protein